MSWFSDNYEKVTLGGAVVVTIALAALGFKNKGDLAEAFRLPAPKKNTETGVAGLQDMQGVMTSLGAVHEVHQADLDGRKVDLFTGVSLFAKKDDLQNPVDLLKSEPVHAGISNTWWLKYGIDPGYSDSPDQDPDDDGFSNREEFTVETDPTDTGSFPEPVMKLRAIGVSTTQVHLKPQSVLGGGKQSMFKLETKASVRVNKMKPDPVVVGDVISFIKPLMDKRFKFVGLDQRQNTNGTVDTIWVIEDLQPSKKGTQYRFDKRGDLDGHPGRALGIMDSTVELTLQALGQGDKSFKIEESGYFSLPFDPKAAKKPYLLKTVDLKQSTVEVEYTDKEGNKQLHVMPFNK